MSQNNLTHNDLKAQNYLVDWPQNQPPSIQNVKIWLSDFGLVDRRGGTPVYASPECFHGSIVGKSDLFSLGRLFTFMVTEDKSIFYALLFLPIQSQTDQNTIRRILGGIPILNFILGMTKVNPNGRCPLPSVGTFLTQNSNVVIVSQALLQAVGFPAGPFQVPFSVNEFTRMLQER